MRSTADLAPVTHRADHGGRLQLLDGLRGLAAIAVVLWHYQHFFMTWPGNALDPRWVQLEPGHALLEPFYTMGRYAVNCFWLISGFVFAHVYHDTKVSAREFALSRFARLYPLHLLTLVVVAVLQSLSLFLYGDTPIYTNNTPEQFVLNLFLASDWGIGRGGSFNGPIWSVSVEVLVYFLFWVTRRRFEASGIAGPALAAALSGAILLTGSGSLVLACAYFFFCGSALAAICRSAHRRMAIVILALTGGLALAGGNAALAVAIGQPGLFGALMLVAVVAEPDASPVVRSLSSWLGDCTYGVYLWNIPLQLLLILVLRAHYDLAELAGHGWFLLAYLGLNLVLARVFFVRFERPLRNRIRQRWTGPASRLSLSGAR